jgi:hypothetical protein
VRFASTTNGSGHYLLPFLMPGSYTINVERPGFKTYARAGVAVRESERVTIDAAMLSDVNYFSRSTTITFPSLKPIITVMGPTGDGMNPYAS